MRELLLDACVMINVAASGVPLGELASRNRVTFAMARLAAAEVLYLAPVDEGGTPERINVMGYARRGDLRLADLTLDEQSTFLKLARDVDDGEAATLAVSLHRGWAVATDDRKAQRLAHAAEPPIALVTTSALLHSWADGHDEPAERVSDVLRRIERRAAFVPRRSDPNRNWWIGAQQQ